MRVVPAPCRIELWPGIVARANSRDVAVGLLGVGDVRSHLVQNSGMCFRG